MNAALIAAALSLLWLVSLRMNDASIVDIFWGFGFVMIAWATLAVTQDSWRSIALTLMTSLWGVRLAVYLAWRNLGKGEDARYQAMRARHPERFWWLSLFTVFGLQGAVMWCVALPLQVAATASAEPFRFWNYSGIGVWLIGFAFEAIGDFQLARFKADPNNRGKVFDRGLWRYTRHPNYFGNALIWWGIFTVAVTPGSVWLVVSPLLMNFLLLKVSGVSLLEKSMKQRSSAYRDYVARTSAFIPRPPNRSPPT